MDDDRFDDRFDDRQRPPTPGLDHNPLGSNWRDPVRDAPRATLWPIAVGVVLLVATATALILLSA
ncbi:hypothetical protein [Leifsonia sp. Le1]|uniref:hypothetical protein n=1 Tax=Leifsonia sp. Le1 TaxID=3404918 RepID=UPI003EBBFB26